MKEKFKKAKIKAKEFWEKHKKKILIGLGIAGAVIAGTAVTVSFNGKNEKTEEASGKTSKLSFPKNLEKPNWGDQYDVSGFIQENPDVKLFTATIPISTLADSEFGDKFINDCSPNPDLETFIMLEYPSWYLDNLKDKDLYFD